MSASPASQSNRKIDTAQLQDDRTNRVQNSTRIPMGPRQLSSFCTLRWRISPFLWLIEHSSLALVLIDEMLWCFLYSLDLYCVCQNIVLEGFVNRALLIASLPPSILMTKCDSEVIIFCLVSETWLNLGPVILIFLSKWRQIEIHIASKVDSPDVSFTKIS